MQELAVSLNETWLSSVLRSTSLNDLTPNIPDLS